MKPIILKHIDEDAKTKYVILENSFSFDHEIVCGTIFIGFYDSKDEEKIYIQTGYLPTDFIDFDVLNDDNYSDLLFDVVTETVQEYVEDYLVSDEEIIDLQGLAAEVEVKANKFYKDFVANLTEEDRNRMGTNPKTQFMTFSAL